MTQLSKNQQTLLDETDFIVGDIVKLLSGGPVMTVLNVDAIKDQRDNDRVIVTCGFFNHSFAYLVNPFPPEALRHCDLKAEGHLYMRFPRADAEQING